MKWKYYNHAAIPTTAPHEEVDLSPIQDGSIWKMPGKPLLARWTSDFDCGYETNWWYTIQDEPIEIHNLSKHVQKEIRRGQAHFEIKRIVVEDYSEQIQKVHRYAVDHFQKSDVSNQIGSLHSEPNTEWIGLFDRESGELVGFKIYQLHEDYVGLVSSKVLPEYKKFGAFAYMNWWQIDQFINSGKYRYLSNGTRTILHDSNYNDFLIEKLHFRKAYCKLHIVYHPLFAVPVKLLYPVRHLINDRHGFSRKIRAILYMEEIHRNSR